MYCHEVFVKIHDQTAGYNLQTLSFSVTRVRSQGKVLVRFNIMTKDLTSQGLDNSQHKAILSHDNGLHSS